MDEVVEERTEGTEEKEETLDEVQKLQAELEQAQAQAAEYLDGWQRARAEFANYKKRQEAERAQLIAFANADLLRKLLPIVDDFERAVQSIPPEMKEQTWVEGIMLIQRKLESLLETEGVTPIETEGETFDPRYHEAVTHEEAEGYTEDQIIGELRRGYMLGERVLRPALVRVAKPTEDEIEKE